MWALGIDNQTIDIERNVKLELINHTIREFARNPERLEQALGMKLRVMLDAEVSDVEELAERFGITYMAPQDARVTSLPSHCFDFVSSTFTLEHIPAADIAAILSETRRLLTTDGLISSLIDMQDHYQYTDPSLSVYSFLRYPSWIWRALNPRLAWQSRLRHSQYVGLYERSGYEILFDEVEAPAASDLDQLKRIRIAPEFRQFSLVDLGTKSTHLFARPGP